MRLVSYQHQNETETRVGVIVNEHIEHIVEVGTDLIALLQDEAGLATARAAAESADLDAATPLAQVTLLPPVVRPGKVIALGRNYAAHAKEGGAEPPKYPMLFHKTHTSLNGHNRPIPIPPGTEQVDYEAELAVVIGKTCKNVTEAEALAYVAGYTCANDVTARDWQRLTSQFTAGKMVDKFCPLGPALVTADDIADVQRLAIKLWHNGTLMQDGNTQNMIFPVAFTIAHISRITTLEAGDVILTGTPAGVGFARTPPVFMQPGDEVTVEIEGVGRLTNRFVS